MGRRAIDVPVTGLGPVVEQRVLLPALAKPTQYLGPPAGGVAEAVRAVLVPGAAASRGSRRPQIEVDVQDLGDRYEILVTTDCFAKSVVLDTQVGDCVFSDNWIDVSRGRPRPVTVLKADTVGIESAEALRHNLTVRSLNDIMIDAAELAGAGLP
jgi:hypothetical protein